MSETRIVKQPTLSTSKPPKIILQAGTLTVSNDLSELSILEVSAITTDYFNKYRAQSRCIVPVDSATNDVIVNSIKNKDPVGILRNSGIAVGGIVGRIALHAGYSQPVLQSTFYNSNLTGFIAARATILAHKFLVEFARLRGIGYVLATCGYWDTEFKLNKILKRNGWQSEGYMSVYQIDGG